MEQDPKDRAAKDILAGLRSRRPADQPTGDAPLEQKVAGADKIIEFGPKPEEGKFEKMVDDVFREGQEKYLANLQEDIGLLEGKGRTYDVEIQQGLLDWQKELGEVLASSGRSLMLEYVRSGLDASSDEPEQIERITKLVGEFREKLDRLKTGLVNSVYNTSMVLEMFESKGIVRDEINDCDFDDLFYRVVDKIKYKEGAIILGHLIQEEPSKIEAYLHSSGETEDFKKTEDYTILRDKFKQQFAEIVLREYEKIAVDTPERIEARKKYAIEKEVDRVIGASALFGGTTVLSRIEDVARENNFKIEQSDVEFVIGELRKDWRIKSRIITYILELHQEKLALDGKNYVPKNQDEMDALVTGLVKAELQKILNKLAAERKPEEGKEGLFSPEQQKVIDVIKVVAQRLFESKKKESESWEGFSGDDKNNMLMIMMKGALQVQFEKRLVPLGVPSENGAIQKLIDDILRDII
jgi:hypothetical protein